MRCLIFITFAAISCRAQQERVQCTNPNEEWTACGRRCGESCADQGKQVACPMACALFGGCSCKQGYARDKNDRCIPKSQCLNQGSNGAGSGCPPGLSIANCFVDPCKLSTCPGVNAAKCKVDYCGGCNAKWFLNGQDVSNQCRKNKTQIERAQCSKPNEEWTECGPRCGESCADQDKQVMCKMMCALQGGCSCKQGYARDSNGRCIPKTKCPSKNGGDSSGCPPGVSVVNCFMDPCVTAACPGASEAQCKADYCGGCNAKWFLNGLDVTNQCRKINNTCRSDEEYQTCGSACPPECGDELMDRACIMMCKTGCFCKQGLVRGPNSRCIKRDECPSKSQFRCAATLCAAGTHCEETTQGARCIADKPQITCATARCAGPCEDTLNGPRCLPQEQKGVCNGNPCGHPCKRCIPESKQCFTTPCPQYRCEQLAGCLGPPIRVNKPGTCPSGIEMIGICVEHCKSDDDCEGSQKCCSNGCGHTCQNPARNS